jgi:hypothetical protein
MKITAESLSNDKKSIVDSYNNSFEAKNYKDCAIIVRDIEKICVEFPEILANAKKVYEAISEINYFSYIDLITVYEQSLFDMLPVYIDRMVLDYFFEPNPKKDIIKITSMIKSVDNLSARESLSNIFANLFIRSSSRDTFLVNISYNYISILHMYLSVAYHSKSIMGDSFYHLFLLKFNELSSLADQNAALVFDQETFNRVMMHIKITVPLLYKSLTFKSISYFFQKNLEIMQKFDIEKYSDSYKLILVPYSDAWHNLLTHTIDILNSKNLSASENILFEGLRQEILEIGFSLRQQVQKNIRNISYCKFYPSNNRLFSFGIIPIATESNEKNVRDTYIISLNMLKMLMNTDNFNLYCSDRNMIGIFRVSNYILDIDRIIESILPLRSLSKSQEQKPNINPEHMPLEPENIGFILYVIGCFKAHFSQVPSNPALLFDDNISNALVKALRLAYSYNVINFGSQSAKDIFFDLYNSVEQHVKTYIYSFDAPDFIYNAINILRELNGIINPRKKLNLDFLFPQEREAQKVFFNEFDLTMFPSYLHIILYVAYKTQRVDEIKQGVLLNFYKISQEKFLNYEMDDINCMKLVALLSIISIPNKFIANTENAGQFMHSIRDPDRNTDYHEGLVQLFTPDFIENLPSGTSLRNIVNLFLLFGKDSAVNSASLVQIIPLLLESVARKGDQDNFATVVICLLIGLTTATASNKKMTLSDKRLLSYVANIRLENEGLLGYSVDARHPDDLLGDFKFIDSSLEGLLNIVQTLINLEKISLDNKGDLVNVLCDTFNKLNNILSYRYTCLLDKITDKHNTDLPDSPKDIQTLLETRLLPTKVHHELSRFFNLMKNQGGVYTCRYPAFAELSSSSAKVCQYMQLAYKDNQVLICVSLDNENWYSSPLRAFLSSAGFHDTVLPFRLLLDISSKKEKQTYIKYLDKKDIKEYRLAASKFVIEEAHTSETNNLKAINQTSLSKEVDLLLTSNSTPKKVSTFWQKLLLGNFELVSEDKDVIRAIFIGDNALSVGIKSDINSLSDFQRCLLSKFKENIMEFPIIIKYFNIVDIMEQDQKDEMLQVLLAGSRDSNSFWFLLLYNLTIKNNNIDSCKIIFDALQQEVITKSNDPCLSRVLQFFKDKEFLGQEAHNILKFAIREFTKFKISGGFQGNPKFSCLDDILRWALKDKTRIANILQMKSNIKSYDSLESYSFYLHWCDLVKKSGDAESYIMLYLHGFYMDGNLSNLYNHSLAEYFKYDVDLFVENKRINLSVKKDKKIELVFDLPESKHDLQRIKNQVINKISLSEKNKSAAYNLYEQFKISNKIDSDGLHLIKHYAPKVLDSILQYISTGFSERSFTALRDHYIFLQCYNSILADSVLFEDAFKKVESEKHARLDAISSPDRFINFMGNDMTFPMLNFISENSHDDFFEGWNLHIDNFKENDLIALCLKSIMLYPEQSSFFRKKFEEIMLDEYACDNVTITVVDALVVTFNGVAIINITDLSYGSIIGQISNFKDKIRLRYIESIDLPNFIKIEYDGATVSFIPDSYLEYYGIDVKPCVLDVEDMKNLYKIKKIIKIYREQLDNNIITSLRNIIPPIQLKVISEIAHHGVDVTNCFAWLLAQLNEGVSIEDLSDKVRQLNTITFLIKDTDIFASIVKKIEANGFVRMPSGDTSCSFWGIHGLPIGIRIKSNIADEYLYPANNIFHITLKDGYIAVESLNKKDFKTCIINFGIPSIHSLKEMKLVYALIRINKWVKRLFKNNYSNVMRHNLSSLGLVDQQSVLRSEDIAFIRGIKMTNPIQQESLDEIKKLIT